MTVTTECAHCGRSMHIDIDSDLNWRAHEPDSAPVAFVPEVNLIELEEESIIESF